VDLDAVGYLVVSSEEHPSLELVASCQVVVRHFGSSARRRHAVDGWSPKRKRTATLKRGDAKTRWGLVGTMVSQRLAALQATRCILLASCGEMDATKSLRILPSICSDFDTRPRNNMDLRDRLRKSKTVANNVSRELKTKQFMRAIEGSDAYPFSPPSNNTSLLSPVSSGFTLSRSTTSPQAVMKKHVENSDNTASSTSAVIPGFSNKPPESPVRDDGADEDLMNV